MRLSQKLSRQVCLNIVGYGILRSKSDSRLLGNCFADESTVTRYPLSTLLYFSVCPSLQKAPHLPFQFSGGFAADQLLASFFRSRVHSMYLPRCSCSLFVNRKMIGSLATFRLVILSYPILLFDASLSHTRPNSSAYAL